MKKPVVAAPDQVALMTGALRGSVVQLSTDSNGNHVIQQCLHHLPLEICDFIFDEITAEVRVVSKHRHGSVVTNWPCLPHFYAIDPLLCRAHCRIFVLS